MLSRHSFSSLRRSSERKLHLRYPWLCDVSFLPRCAGLSEATEFVADQDYAPLHSKQHIRICLCRGMCCGTVAPRQSPHRPDGSLPCLCRHWEAEVLQLSGKWQRPAAHIPAGCCFKNLALLPLPAYEFSAVSGHSSHVILHNQSKGVVRVSTRQDKHPHVCFQKLALSVAKLLGGACVFSTTWPASCRSILVIHSFSLLRTLHSQCVWLAHVAGAHISDLPRFQ